MQMLPKRAGPGDNRTPVDPDFQRYLGWLRDRWQVILDAAGAEELPPVDPSRYSFFSPLGGSLGDHATEITLRAIQRRPAIVRDRLVWEVGCGGGVVAVTCALAGAREVWATDVDPAALGATRDLAERNHAPVRVARADLLDGAPFDGHPDLIIANLPQKPVDDGESLSNWENGGRDGTRLLRPFLDQAQDRLAPGGEILYLTHSLPHPSALRLLHAHFVTELVAWRRRVFEPTAYIHGLRDQDTCWFTADAFFLLQTLARRRTTA